MTTAVSRSLVRTRLLVILLCISLCALSLHMEFGTIAGLKMAVLSGLADDSGAGHSPVSVEDKDSKKGWRPSPLFEGIAKLHFIVGLGMFLFIALMVVADDIMARALLLVPIVLLFWGSKVLFAIDQANMAADMMRRYKPR